MPEIEVGQPITGTAVTNSEATQDVPTNNEICYRTGFRLKRGKLKEEWQGILVRAKSFEARNSQEFIRGFPENPKGSPRPEQPDRFTTGFGDLSDLDP